jgi:hypothetical protein
MAQNSAPDIIDRLTTARQLDIARNFEPEILNQKRVFPHATFTTNRR